MLHLNNCRSKKTKWGEERPSSSIPLLNPFDCKILINSASVGALPVKKRNILLSEPRPQDHGCSWSKWQKYLNDFAVKYYKAPS